MFELGAAIAFGEFVLALLWYREANARFSEKIVGYDGTRSAPIRELLTNRRRDAAKILRAWDQPSPDQETERWRLLMQRRFRLMMLGPALFVVLPPLLGLIELDARILSRGSLGLLWLVGIAALLLYWFSQLALVLIRYGRAEQLDVRRLWTAVGGIVVVGIVLLGVLLTAYVQLR
jgi:hypothetical protein